MEVCSNGHEEICFVGRSCPACLLLGDIATLEKELEQLKEAADA